MVPLALVLVPPVLLGLVLVVLVVLISLLPWAVHP
jgi:hypothetical protein